MLAYDPLNPAITRNPYPYYAALREESPVKFIPSLQGYAVSRWDDVVKTLTEPKIYSSSKFWPALLGEYDPVPEEQPIISLDPPDHVPIRKLAVGCAAINSMSAGRRSARARSVSSPPPAAPERSLRPPAPAPRGARLPPESEPELEPRDFQPEPSPRFSERR